MLLLLWDHRRANLGLRAAWWFFAASSAYGLVRSLSIRALAESKLGGAPYTLTAPLATLFGVPLQELLGWTVAVGLASYLADRLLRRFGRPTDAYRTTLVAGLVMAVICLTVESAAVVGGWWSWSLGHDPGSLLRFPTIALVDWGFVAIDFLLPFELWRRRAPLSARLLSLFAFPVHLAGHALTAKLPGPIPISGFDFVHVALVAAVVALAVVSRADSPWPPIRAEVSRIEPLLAATLVVTTAAIQLLLVDDPNVWTGLPLLGLALIAASVRSEPVVRPAPWNRGRAALLFGGVLVAGLALRLPEAYRSRQFEGALRQAAELLVAQQPEAAMVPLEQAIALRPQHSEALWLLGWAQLQRGNRAEARRHLEASLAARPDSNEAAELLAALDRAEGR